MKTAARPKHVGRNEKQRSRITTLRTRQRRLTGSDIGLFISQPVFHWCTPSSKAALPTSPKIEPPTRQRVVKWLRLREHTSFKPKQSILSEGYWCIFQNFDSSQSQLLWDHDSTGCAMAECNISHSFFLCFCSYVIFSPFPLWPVSNRENDINVLFTAEHSAVTTLRTVGRSEFVSLHSLQT